MQRIVIRGRLNHVGLVVEVSASYRFVEQTRNRYSAKLVAQYDQFNSISLNVSLNLRFP